MSFIEFEVHVIPPSGLTLYGDCPTIIEYVSEIPTLVDSGSLKYQQGDNYQVLIDRGLFPSVGDIIICIEDTVTTHLSSIEVYVIIIYCSCYSFI